jgi:hypothetical protein
MTESEPPSDEVCNQVCLVSRTSSTRRGRIPEDLSAGADRTIKRMNPSEPGHPVYTAMEFRTARSLPRSRVSAQSPMETVSRRSPAAFRSAAKCKRVFRQKPTELRPA